MRKHKMNRFLFIGDTSITRSLNLNLSAQRGLAFFAHIEKKYRVRQAFEKFPLYFLRLPHLSDTTVIEYQLSFKPLFHWTLVNSAAPPFGSPLNRLITPSLTRSLTPSVTRSLTRLLTRSFSRSTSFTFITHLHEGKREIRSESTYLVHQSPDAAAERIRADIFNYFFTLNKITRQTTADDREQAMPVPYKTPAVGGWHCLPPANILWRQTNLDRTLEIASINHLITSSLTRSLTPSVTRSLTQLLTRSFLRSTSFITHLHEEKKEIESESTYLIHQSPDAAAERIRADIFNYFSTLNRVTSQASAASINRLITRSLTRSLTPSVTQSLTQLLTRSSTRPTSFITHLHEEKGEKGFLIERRGPANSGVRPAGPRDWETTGDTYLIHQSPDAAAERIRADIFNYFSTFSRVTSQAAPASINRLITRSLTRSLTPSVTRSLTQQLTRSFIHSTSFITHLHEEKREIKSETIKEIERERSTGYTYLIHQSPEASAERIRADIFNYFSTLSRITRQSSAASINRLITRSLTRSLTPSVTQSLTQQLTRSFIRSTSFITHLHEEKKEIRSERVKKLEQERKIEIAAAAGEKTRDWTLQFLTTGSEAHFTFPIADTNLIHQSPDAAAERIRTNIFNYFSTLSRVTSQSPAASINRLITSSLTRSLTPSVTRSVTQLLTRSFNHSTSFITHLHEGKREIKSERVMKSDEVKELEREQGRSRTGFESHFTFPIADTSDTTLIHQSPDAAAERIRADIFNYFSTLGRITSQAPPASINRLITSSLTRTLTPSVTRSVTQLLTRSFNRSTSFITHLHGPTGSESHFTFPIADTSDTYLIHESPDAAAERIRADIFNYFSTLNKMWAAPTPQDAPPLDSSINRLITPSSAPPLTPSLTRLLTQLITRSFNRFTTFITHLHEQKKEREIRERERQHRIEHTFSSSINRLITPSLPPSLTPSTARSFTQLLTHSFSPSTLFITHLHEGSPFTLHKLTASSSITSFTPSSAPSSVQSFNHNTAFITYLYKGRKEKEGRIEMGAAAGDETRDRKSEMEKPAPRTYGEAVKEKAPLPEVPGFERERLESRYTSALYLAGKQDAQMPHTHWKGGPLSIPAKEWLSSRAVTADIKEPGSEPPSIENFLQKGREQAAAGRPATAQRIIDLSSLAGENDSNRHRRPVIKHALPGENSLSEERIKKIEQTISTHTKQFETRMKDAITTSTSSFASGVSAGVPQGMNLSSLTDNIYNLLLERVKRERRMMGY